MSKKQTKSSKKQGLVMGKTYKKGTSFGPNRDKKHIKNERIVNNTRLKEVNNKKASYNQEDAYEDEYDQFEEENFEKFDRKRR
jgi:arginase family enzyme